MDQSEYSVFTLLFFLFFFFNDAAPTEIYTLSLHDALPICTLEDLLREVATARGRTVTPDAEPEKGRYYRSDRSEEHTSELQSHHDLVCRLLLEKKKKKKKKHTN